MKMLRLTCLAMALLLCSIAFGQTTYYSKPGANLAANLTSSWSSSRDGSGASPANFTTGDVFVVQGPANGTTNMITTAAFALSGTNAKLQVENGGVLTASHAITLSATTTFRLDAGATYEHNQSASAASTTIFGGVESFDPASTIRILNWNGTSAVHTGITASAVSNGTTYYFGNLEIARSGLTSTWSQTSATINYAAGNVTVSALGAGGVFNLVAAGTITVNIGGTLSMTSATGTLQLASTGNSPTINVGSYSQSAGTLNFNSSTGSTTLNVTGAYTVSGGTITNSSTGNGLLVFKGSSQQAVTISGSPAFTTTSGRLSVTLNNAAGINLTGNLWVVGNHASAAAVMTITSGSISGTGAIQYGGSGTGSAQGSTSLVYATAASYTATAAEFPASNGPTGLTANVGAGNTLSFPASFSRTLAKQLAMTSGNLAIGVGNMLTLSNTTLSGQLAYTTGTFITSGGLARYLPTSGLPTTASGNTGRYPFGISSQIDRSVYVYFSAATLTGGTAGIVGISYNPTTGATTGLSVTDNGVTLDRRSNTGWSVSTGTFNTGSNTMAVSVWASFVGSAGTLSVLRLTNGTAGFGTLVTSTGTAQAPVLGKSGLQASDIDGKTLYVGSTSVNSLARCYLAVTGASNWGDPASWVGNDGTIPGAANDAVIPGGNTMLLQGSTAGPYTCGSLWFSSGSGTGTLTVASGTQLSVTGNIGNSITGAITISGGSLLVGGNCANNSTFTLGLSSGTFSVAGSVSSATTAANTPATYTISGGAFSAGSINTTNTSTSNTALTFTITGGTVAVSGSIATTSSNLVLSLTNATVSAGSIATTTSMTTTLNSGSLSVSGNVSGNNHALTVNGGSLSVTGSYSLGTSATANLTAGTVTLGTLSIGSTSASAFKVSGATVNITGGAGTGIGWTANGTLTLSAGSLTVGPAGGGNRAIAQSTGTFTISGGTLTLNGSYLQSGGTLNLSAGTVVIDGNDGTLAGSVSGSTSLWGITGGTENVTGGTITIVDPVFPDAGNTGDAIRHSSGTSNTWSGGTLYLGDGISTTAGSSGKGFSVECFNSTGRLTLNNVVFTGNSTGRCFYGPVKSGGEVNIGGNFTLSAGTVFNNAATGSFNVGGNLVNNGLLSIAKQLGLRKSGGAASTVAQAVSGSGTVESGTGLADNQVKALVINNTSTAGLSLGNISGVTGTLTLTAGRTLMGANSFTLPASATLSGTPSSANLFVQTGTGRFKRVITTTANTTYVFPVGTYNGSTYAYTGASLLFASNSVQRTITIDVTAATHPDMQTGTTSTNYLQRYWSFSDDQAGNGTYSWRPTFTYSSSSPNDVAGVYTQLKVSYWNGSAWTMFSTTSTITTTTIALSSNVTQATGPLQGTAWTGRRDGATSYVWTGGSSVTWTDPSNWTGGAGSYPNSASDDVQINAGTTFSPEINGGTISVNTLSVAAGATLTVKGGATLTLNDNVTWAGSGVLSNSTLVFASSTNAQTVPALNYQNLSLSGAGAKSFSGGITGVAGTLSISGAAPTVAGSTIRYNGTGSQTVLNTTYDNLEITGSRGAGTITFGAGTLNVGGNFTASATFTTGGYSVNSGHTFVYNGSGAQTLAGFNYRNLTVSGDRGGGTLGLGSGTVQISGTLAWTATNYTADAGSGTMRFTGTSQAVPALSYYNLDLGSATTPVLASGTTGVAGTLSPGALTTAGSGTFDFNGDAQSIPALTYNNLSLSGTGIKTLAGTTTVSSNLDIAVGVTLSLGSQSLSLAGNWTNNGVLQAGTGAVAFTGTGAQALTSTGDAFYQLEVNKSAGTLTIGGPITVNGALLLTAGTLSGGAQVSLAPGASLTRNGAALDATPVFGGLLDLVYASGSNLTTSFELPTADMVRNFTVSGGGRVTLSGAVNVNGTLTLTNGVLDIANYDLTVAAGSLSGGSSASYVKTSGSGVLKIKNVPSGGSFFPVGNSSYNPVSIANPVTLDWSVNVADAVSGVTGGYAPNVAKAVSRQWDITPSQNSPAPGGGATITFYYNGTTDVGASFSNATDVQLWHYYQGFWAKRGSAQTPITAGGMKSITVGGLTYFSPYAISNIDAPLPVTFLSFTGKRTNSVNELKWTTASEQNNRGFAVERSQDGVSFTQVGFVVTRAQGGTSTSDISYSFTDASTGSAGQAANSKWYYRLKQVDLDGQYKYSSVVLLKSDKSGVLTVEGIYPNPVKASASVRLQAPASGGQVLLQLTDMQGRTVKVQSALTEGGSSSTVSLNLSGLAAGSYHLRAIAPDGSGSEVVTVVKQ